eukprot:1667222-Amphidinium_carterae.1
MESIKQQNPPMQFEPMPAQMPPPHQHASGPKGEPARDPTRRDHDMVYIDAGVKAREANSIELPELPTSPELKSWRSAVRRLVAAASTSPQHAFRW